MPKTRPIDANRLKDEVQHYFTSGGVNRPDDSIDDATLFDLIDSQPTLQERYDQCKRYCEECAFFNGHRTDANEWRRKGVYVNACDAFGVYRGARKKATPRMQACKAFRYKWEVK